MNAEIRLILLSALVGFGGLCIAAQNLAACRTAGVRPLRYFGMRIGSAGMMAGWMGVQLQLRVSGGGRTLSALPFAALIACGLAVPVPVSYTHLHDYTHVISTHHQISVKKV